MTSPGSLTSTAPEIARCRAGMDAAPRCGAGAACAVTVPLACHAVMTGPSGPATGWLSHMCR